jgi:hypothetical protein
MINRGALLFVSESFELSCPTVDDKVGFKLQNWL